MNGRVIGMLMLVVAVGVMLGGCVSTGRGGAEYVLAYLKTGPNSAAQTTEQRGETFKGHMANIHRLADAGELVIAGPFGKPRDPAWRGIFVLDTPSVETAREWTGTDPAVAAGVFVCEFRRLRASEALRRTTALEKEMTIGQAAKPSGAGEPPPNVRGYVMVTAEDAARTERAIARSTLAGKVVWCGRFEGSGADREGVFVLDSTSADEVSGVLLEDQTGPRGVDGWWSSACLMRLPAEARRLP